MREQYILKYLEHKYSECKLKVDWKLNNISWLIILNFSLIMLKIISPITVERQW